MKKVRVYEWKTLSSTIWDIKSLQLYQLFGVLKGNIGKGMSTDFKKSMVLFAPTIYIYSSLKIINTIWNWVRESISLLSKESPCLIAHYSKKQKAKMGFILLFFFFSKFLFLFSESLFRQQLMASLMETTNM